jgi:hypothetical protein
VGTENLAEVFASDILHIIEHDEIAHANIQIRLAAHVDEDSVEGIKTVIVDRLWHSSRGPLRHICDVDGDLIPRLEEDDPSAPAVMHGDQSHEQ